MKPYLPAPLPLLPFKDPELHAEVSRANQEIGRFDGALLGLVNPTILLSPLMTQEAILSSRIEGTITTLQEVLMVRASDDVDLEPERKNSAIEVVNYRKALAVAVESLDSREFTINLVRQLHEVLMDSVRGHDKSPGQVRRGPAFIGLPGATVETASYVGPGALHLDSLLENLGAYVANSEDDPIIAAAVVHAQFEMIHPFEDGNGRMGRMLVPLYLYHRKALRSPVFYLSEYLESNWERYFAGLQGISRRGDWTDWVKFFAGAVREQAVCNTQKAREIIGLYESMKRELHEVARTRFSLPLLDSLFDLVVFKSEQFIKYTGISKRTALRLLHDLRDAGILKPLRDQSGSRGAILVFARLFNLVEGRDVV
jgi:cell filamentation protein, protein adenylyltransferase